jgi:outer membrane scaffolding protein for murein synthesis (MipA/OmpV family)
VIRSRLAALPAAVLALGAVALAPMPVAAQAVLERGETVPLPQRPAAAWSLNVGALAGLRPDYEGSDNYSFLGAPLVELRYGGDRFFVSSRDGVGATLVRIGGFTAGPVLRYRFGRDQDDNDALRGMGDVGGTAEAGLFLRFQEGGWVVVVNAAQGLNGGGHRGATVFASLGYGGRLAERWRFSLGPSITWASDNYMQSFFGVTPSQAARSAYSPYSPGAGVKDVGFGGTLTWLVTDQMALTGIVEVKELLNDAADSPLVERAGNSTQGFFGLALSYRFNL